jgi:hypothetical protein
MEIVGGIFRDEKSLTPALDSLADAGFKRFMIFGAEDLLDDGGLDERREEDSISRKHTAAGTISGISANPPSNLPDDRKPQSGEDDLMGVGLPEEEAEEFVRALQQDRLLLLVQTKAGRAPDAEEILRANEAQTTRRLHPQDAFPEELWRPPRG